MAGLVLMGTLDSWQNSPLEFQFYKFGPCNLLNKPYGPLKYYYPKTKPAKPLPPKPQPTPAHQAQSHQNILPVHFNTSPSQTPSLTISPTWLPSSLQHSSSHHSNSSSPLHVPLASNNIQESFINQKFLQATHNLPKQTFPAKPI